MWLTKRIVKSVVSSRLTGRYGTFGELTTAAEGKIGGSGEYADNRRGSENERRKGNHDDGVWV